MNKILTHSMLAAIIFGGMFIALPVEAHDRDCNNYWRAEAEHWPAPQG